MVSNQCPFSFNLIFGNRKKSQGANQGSMVSRGWQPSCFSPETGGWRWKCKMGHCHGEAAKSVLWWSSQVCSSQILGRRLHTFSRNHRKSHIRTRNSHFGLLRQILCAQSLWRQRKWWSCWWHCFSPVWPFLVLMTWGFSTGRIVTLSQGRNRKPSSHYQWWPWTRKFHHRRRADNQCRRSCAAASGQLSWSWAQICLWHGAFSILSSEPIGMSITNSHLLRNFVNGPMSILKDKLLKLCNSFRSCTASGPPCVFVIINWCVTCLELGMPLTTPVHDSGFGPQRLVESLWGSL